MATSIQARIVRILRCHFLVRPVHFLPTQQLDQDYNLGQLERLELANCLEGEFHFDFQDQEVAEFRTLGGVVAAVRRHLRTLSGPGAAAAPPRLRLLAA